METGLPGPEQAGPRRDNAPLPDELTFRQLAEMAPAMLWATNAQHECTFLSRGWYEYTGQALDEGLGHGWMRAVHPDDQGSIQRIFQEAAERREPCTLDYRLRRADGAYRWVIDAAQPRLSSSGAFLGFVGSIIDVHDRKSAEQSLARSEERFRLATDALHGMIYDWDPASGRVWRSGGLQRLLGHRPVDVPATAVWWREQIHPDDEPLMERRFEHALAEHQEACGVEYRVLHRDGRYVWVWDRRRLVYGEDGKLARVIGCAVSVDDRRLAESAAEQARSGYQRLLNAIPVAVYSALPDATRTTTFISDRYTQLTGQTLEDFENDPAAWPKTVHVDDRERAQAAFARACASGGDYHCEYRLVHAYTGRVRWVRDHGSAVREPAGRLVRFDGTIADITAEMDAEQALRESEERLRMAIEGTDQGTFDWDLRLNVLRWSPRTRRMFGLQADEPVSIETFFARLHPDDRKRLKTLIEQAQDPTGEGDFRAEYRVLWPDQSIRWIDARGKVMFDGQAGNRRPRRFIGTVSDVTDRHRAEDALRDSEDRFRTLADNIAQLAWMADETGWNFWFNRRWLDYTGCTLAEMQGWGWRKVHHPDHVVRVVVKYSRAIADGVVWEDTFPLRGKDGRYRWFLSRAIPIRDEQGRVLRWFGTNTDITSLREAEESLRDADRRKDEFLATLAHELRNPLAPIRNAVQILRLAGNNPEATERSRDIIERQLTQLVRLVDDLLDVSRISRGKIELRHERLTLAEIINVAIETSRPLIEQMGHELRLELPAEPVPLEGDRTRLAQIFANLLNNAAKYSERGGRITVAAEKREGDVVVRVIDTGIGIRRELLGRVFDMFIQADRSLERSHGGLGVGLTLVKSLVEMHGGSVKAISEGPGKGTEFVVTLPLAAEAPAESLPPAPDEVGEEAAGPGCRVLVVDDNVDATNSLSAILRLSGHDVRIAFDGESALAIAAAEHPECILLDIGLPKLNGYEAARRIRSEPWGKDVVLIAMTGWGQLEDKRKAHAAGFDHHMTKPVDLKALEDLLGEICPKQTAPA